MGQKVEKSRVLELNDYYSILQKEYICYYIRSLIYIEPYSGRYKGYLVSKRDKIEKIAVKNSTPSIFTDLSYYKKQLSQVIRQWGLPEFEYRDEESKKIMGFWDKIYWFQVGTQVEVKIDSKTIIGAVKLNSPLKQTVNVLLADNRRVTTDYINVSRCLDKQFEEIF